MNPKCKLQTVDSLNSVLLESDMSCSKCSLHKHNVYFVVQSIHCGSLRQDEMKHFGTHLPSGNFMEAIRRVPSLRRCQRKEADGFAMFLFFVWFQTKAAKNKCIFRPSPSSTRYLPIFWQDFYGSGPTPQTWKTG